MRRLASIRDGWIAVLIAFVTIALFIVATMLFPTPPQVHAQNSGQFGASTVSKSFATASAAGILTVNQPTNPSFPTLLPNIGQSAHILTYCASGATAIRIWLEGSYDAVNWVVISQIGQSLGNSGVAGCSLVQAAGYYQNVRANLNVLTGGGATVNAWYSATAGPIPFVTSAGESFGPASLVQCDASTFFNVADNTTNQLIVQGFSPIRGIYVCGVTLSTTAAGTVGTVTFFEAPTGACGSTVRTLYGLHPQINSTTAIGSGDGTIFRVAPSPDSLCMSTSGLGNTIGVAVSYATF